MKDYMKSGFVLAIVMLLNVSRMQCQDNSNDVVVNKPISFASNLFMKEDCTLCTSQAYSVHQSVMEAIQKNKPSELNLVISHKGVEYDILLNSINLLGENISVKDEKGNRYPIDGLFYRGKVKGEQNSMATLSLIRGTLSLLVNSDKAQFEINKIDGSYLLAETNGFGEKEISCFTEDGDLFDLRSQGISQRSQANCLEVFVEVDYNLFVANNNNIGQLTSWTSNVFNNVAALYALHNVPIYLSGVFFHTSPDSYTTNLTESLNAFVNANTSGIAGKVGFLMSGKTMGGGISQGIGGFCNALTAYPGPFAIAGDMTVPSVAYPTYSYNVMIMAHELGHVMGLRHTHACVWNGNNTQIDDCGNVYAANNGFTPEGTNCFNSNSPILPGNNGTIMSNCHLLNNNAINFGLGFGSQPGAILYNNFINAPCSLGDGCSGIPPINDACANAIPLAVTKVCEVKVFDNNLATSSGVSPSMSCGDGVGALDVWFTVQIPSSGNLTIESKQVTNGLTDMVMEAYQGSCGSLVSIICDDDNGDIKHAKIRLVNRTPNEIVYIRVIENGSNLSGDFGICAYSPTVACHPDFDALLNFYAAMGGSSWTDNTGWIDGDAGSDCDVCSWNGVVCNDYNRVRELTLESNNLTGVLSNALVSLPFLDKINFYSNAISGSIPSFIKDIPLLEFIDLGANTISGGLSTDIGSCPNLRSLFVDNNALNGSLPFNLVNAPLQTIWINGNNFSGCIPNTYFDFCTRSAVVNMENNPLLPFSGSYVNLCVDSLGADIDNDGFCGGSEDCRDTDPNSFPGAVELCDGLDNNCNSLVDEGSIATANTWLSNSNDWFSPLNWSTGIIPQTCHDVYLYPATSDSLVIYALDAAVARSLTIGQNAKLHIQNFSSLKLQNVGTILNEGVLSIYGELLVDNPTIGSATNLYNSGVVFTGSSGKIDLNGNQTSLFNASTGVILNKGILTFGNMSFSTSIGIDNYGQITNEGVLKSINIAGLEAALRLGSTFNNQEASEFDLK